MKTLLTLLVLITSSQSGNLMKYYPQDERVKVALHITIPMATSFIASYHMESHNALLVGVIPALAKELVDEYGLMGGGYFDYGDLLLGAFGSYMGIYFFDRENFFIKSLGFSSKSAYIKLQGEF